MALTSTVIRLGTTRVSVTRQTTSGGYNAAGVWVPAGPTAIPDFTCTVQPTTGDDLRRAPEGFGSRKLRTFYSPVLLQAEDAKAGKAADSVVFNGNDAEPLKVYHCEPWTERAGYYKVQVIGDYV